MEQKLVLSSQIARVKHASNTASDFTTVFDRPIVLGGNQRYVIGLYKCFKCFVIKPFALDLRGSNFGALIGFEPTVIRQSQCGTDVPNITNSLDTLNIHCDLVANSIVDGECW